MLLSLKKKIENEVLGGKFTKVLVLDKNVSNMSKAHFWKNS